MNDRDISQYAEIRRNYKKKKLDTNEIIYILKIIGEEKDKISWSTITNKKKTKKT
jgi:hypothetical protein